MYEFELPYHLQTLARVGPKISLEVEGPITAGSIVDAIVSGAEPFIIRGAIAGG